MSFISLTLVLPALVPFLKAEGCLLMLVKPQFELQPGQVGKGGIVKDPALYAVVEQRIRVACADLGLAVRRLVRQPHHRRRRQPRVFCLGLQDGCRVNVEETSAMDLPLSFEFFPPKTPEGVEKLRGVRQQLYALAPEFCSVTYGAGGSTQEGTFNAVREILAEGVRRGLAPRCMGHSRQRARAAADAKAMGVQAPGGPAR